MDPGGRTLAVGGGRLDVQRPAPRAAEQDAEDWWAAARVALAEVRAAAPEVTVEAVGLTGQKHALLVLDERGEPLDRAWLWADGRAVPEAAALAAALPDLVARTGAPALPGYLVPKWHAWRARNPALADRARALCFAKDWLRLRLTGVAATDPTEAAAAQVYDPRRGTWSPDLTRALDLPLALLPPVATSTAVTGTVIAEGTGLVPGTPVVAGAGDNEAGSLACGVLEPGVAVVILGTSATVTALVPRRRVPRGLVAGPTGLARGVLGTGVVLDAGGAVAWLAETVFPPATSPATVLEAAASARVGPDVPIFLPALSGARSPVPLAPGRGAFFGLGARTGRAELALAVAEGIAVQIARTVELLGRAGARIEELRVTSGGAASPFLRGLVAAACALPSRTVGTREGTARGAALLAATRGEREAAVRARAAAWCHLSELEPPDPGACRRLADVRTRLLALESRPAARRFGPAA